MSETYRIQRPSEETECYNCGWPLYVGDTVHTEDQTVPHTFCCGACLVTCAQTKEKEEDEHNQVSGTD